MPDSAKPDALPTQDCSRSAHHWRGSYHAGLRRVDGVGYQTQLAQAGMLFWISIGILAIVALILGTTPVIAI